MAPRDWTSLPSHLLGALFDRLYVLDFLRCRAVCTSWRLAASTENPHGPTGPQLPMLLLLPPEACQLRSGFRTLFSLAENRYYRLPLPGSPIFRRSVGSSPESGLLVTEDASTRKIFLINLLTGTESTLSAPLVYDNSLPKVITIFPRPQLISILTFLSTFSRKLSFARVGDKRWTDNIGQYCSDSSDAENIEDVVFHRNRLYGVGYRGRSISFDIAASPPIAIPLPECGPEDDDRDNVSSYYLAESADGAHLFQIWRYTEYSSISLSGCMWTVVRTKHFKIFMLVDNSAGNEEWVETKNIGENSAIFLGFGQPLLISTRHLPELEGNCIYYTDTQYFHRPVVHDTGIFSIGDGCCKPAIFTCELFISTPLLSSFWFIPHL